MDGMEVYSELKKINRFVKVLILSGYNIDKEIEDQFSENLLGYVQKPVSIEKLSQSISEALFSR
jgi:DNA-binding NarL/FixJ family response regulator